MTPAPPSLTIVIPMFDEQRRLPATFAGLRDWIDDPRLGIRAITLADDGSSDGTVAIAHAFAEELGSDGPVAANVLTVDHNAGKGDALRRGFLAAETELVAFVDADLPITLETMASLVDASRTADLVVGSRRSNGSHVSPPQPLFRRLGGWLLARFIAAAGFGVTTDPQCGAKVLRADALRPVVEATSSERFAFDVELIARAKRAGLPVVDMPIEWRHVDGSTLRPIRDGVATVLDLVRLRRRLPSG